MEQALECVLRQTELADVDGVLGDAVELRRMAAKPTLVCQRVGNVLDQDFLWVWVQRPKPQAGESANEAVETIHTVSETRLAARQQFPLGECGALQHRREHRRWRAETTGVFGLGQPTGSVASDLASAFRVALDRGRSSKRRCRRSASPSAPARSPPAKPQDPSTLAFRRRSVRSRRTRSTKTPRGTARCAAMSP